MKQQLVTPSRRRSLNHGKTTHKFTSKRLVLEYFLSITKKNLAKLMPEFIDKRIWHINEILTSDGETFGYEFQECYFIKINFLDFFFLTYSKQRLWKGSLVKKL